MDYPYASDPQFEPVYPPATSHPSLAYGYQQQLQPRRSYSALQVTTAHRAPHEQDPSEYTAHPSHYHSQSIPDVSHSSPSTSSYSTSASSKGLTRPLQVHEQERLAHLDRLKFFLATAPSRWDADSHGDATSSSHPNNMHPALNRFLLPSQEYVSCVLWNSLYHITGTDIVRALVFRFEAFGRPVKNMKKFEEGVFSDLRNLKPGVDACLEEPKSPFLDLLFKYQCIRTQKKQKVFYWFSVPHDRLFLDALERDLKREKMGQEPTTTITGEPALSFQYDPKRTLYEQFSKAQGVSEGEGELEAAVRRANEALGDADPNADPQNMTSSAPSSDMEDVVASGIQGSGSSFFQMFSVFEGSPTYKQRRKKVARAAMRRSERSSSEDVGIGYGPADSGLSAADMFMQQARGEQISANPAERERERRRREAQARSQSGEWYDASRQSRMVTQQNPLLGVQPSMVPSSTSSAPSSRASSLGRQEQRHNTYPPASSYPYPPPPRHASSLPYTSSNGDQVVKVKAFVCPLFSCGRLFKRMEHMKRHLRTHTMERPYSCQQCNKRFSRSDNLNQHMRTHRSGGGEEADNESEEDDPSLADVRVCEVEVPAREVHANDEEGLPSSYYTGAVGEYTSSPSSADGQWAPRPLPSPAFSVASAHSPQPRGVSTVPRSSAASPNYMRQSYDAESYVTSISAPSHKQGFDHVSLYPPEVMNGLPSSPGPGPIRRYRSMTPSLIRGQDSVRRPMSGDFGRGYHPYALAANSGYNSSSAQSSPANYPIPLDYVPSQTPQQVSMSSRETHPRSAQHMQEQLTPMLTMDGETIYTNAAVPSNYGDAYRTDSPVPYQDTARTTYAQGQPVYGSDVQQQYDGNYYATMGHPQHVSI